ncbi:hypothetical protein QR98_0091870 [Sarcoptes scabiei]|uniref:Uncharacterized protein n=1 Tax=Sarcoptes scabiei TaxID=52283 RepID=A0A132AI78_SARSC|nr:hypothetical protein QR98_0091870 [Sarcoptes scabiei]
MIEDGSIDGRRMLLICLQIIIQNKKQIQKQFNQQRWRYQCRSAFEPNTNNKDFDKDKNEEDDDFALG